MSCFLVLNAFAGEDQESAAKKLAMMFRMAPQQAQQIVDQVAKGKVWKFQNQVSDQQAAVAENYLKGIGFQVERSGAQQAVVDRIAGTVTKTPAPPVSNRPPRDHTTPPPGLPPTGSQAGPPSGGGTQASSPPPKGRSYSFHGNGWELFKISLVNWILTILTFGIYYFWGKTKVRRYLCEQSSFYSDRFSYHGTGGELFKGAVVFGLILTAINFGAQAIGTMWGPETQMMAQMGMTYLFLMLIPVIMVGAFRYRLSRTAWRGIRFSFRGQRKSALWLYLKGYFLTVLTLGLYWPYFLVQIQKFWTGQAYFGSHSFEYHGEGKDIFKPFLWLLLGYFVAFGTPIILQNVLGMEGQVAVALAGIFYFLLGVGFIYFTAFLTRYHWSKTRFAGGTFNFGATGGQLLGFHLVNLLIVLASLGLALPWVTVRGRNYLATHLAVAGNMQMSQVVQDAQKSGALGEGFADGFDMDIDMGF